MTEGRLPHKRIRSVVGCCLFGLGIVGATAQYRRPPVDKGWLTTQGVTVNPLLKHQRPTVLVFLLTDCPIAKRYTPEIGRINRAYGAKVSFYVVYVDAALRADAAIREAKKHDLASPILLDPSRSLAKRVGATTSPEAVLLDGDCRIAYRGRIDDRYVDYSKSRPEPKRRDLIMALDSVLNRRPVTRPRTSAVGCIFRVDGKGRGLAERP